MAIRGHRGHGVVLGIAAASLALAGCATAPPPLTSPTATDVVFSVPQDTTSLPWLPYVQGPVTASDPVPELQGTGPLDDVAEEDLNQMATVMTSALDDQDAALWLSLFDDADGTADEAGLHDLQQAWFSTVQQVPMDLREMHFTRVVEADDTDGSAYAVAQFGFRHQISGADRVPAVQHYQFRVERDADGYLTIGEIDGTGGLSDTYPQVWDLGPAEVLIEDSLVAIVPADDADQAKRVVPELAEATDQALADFPVDGVHRMVVNLAGTDDLSTLFAMQDASGYAGFALYVPDAPDISGGVASEPARVESGDIRTVRVALDLPYTVEEITAFPGVAGGSPLMRHEGLHVVMMLQTQIFGTQLWIAEGFAGWYESIGDPEITDATYDWYASVVEEPPNELPPGSSLLFHGDGVERNYAESAMVFHYIEAEWGYETTHDLGVALHRANADDREVDDVLREHLQVDLGGLESGFVEWASDQLS